MGVIKKDLVESGVIKEDEKCHICGDIKASGFWAGHNGVLCVCEFCAKDILPLLIVDSLRADDLKVVPNMERVLEHIEGVFWRAAYIRLQSQR